MKKVINAAMLSALIAGSVSVAPSVAQAEDYTINMLGASAQYNYWVALADDYLETRNCTAKLQSKADSKNVAFKGTGCDDFVGGTGTIILTYSSSASLEGLKAVKGEVAIDGTHCSSDSDKLGWRNVADGAACTSWGVAGTSNFGSCTKACQKIHAGTSDVEGSSFGQTTYGHLYGHKGTGSATDAYPTSAISFDATFTRYQPTIVPFSFYVNNNIGGKNAAGVINNLTRTQAINLFAGNVSSWNQLSGFADFEYEVALCLRHAGSGTHATLDKAIFRGDANIINAEKTDEAPYAYFYKSSSETNTSGTIAGVKECIIDNAGITDSDVAAIGYMDADVNNTDDFHRMTYQGASAVDKDLKFGGVKRNDNINLGSYDFWSAQQVYIAPGYNNLFVQDLMTFASTHIPTDEKFQGVWSSQSALKVTKEHDINVPMINPLP